MKKFWQGTKTLIANIGKDEIMTYSANIAFYTLFSLPAMILVILFTTNLFVGENTVNSHFYTQIGSLIGEDSAVHLKESIGSISIENQSWFNGLVGIGTLIFAATTLFATLQNALNHIWGVKAKPERGWVKIILTRLLSFAMVLLLAFIMMASLLLDAVFATLGEYIHESMPGFSEVYAIVINNAISFFTITLLFGLMFKILPDVIIKWKNIWVGAMVTAVLFFIGKYAISFYLGQSTLSGTYGAAGALVILLLWVYYLTTLILIGVEFTKVYTAMNGDRVIPNKHAVFVEVRETESFERSKDLDVEE